MGTSSIELAEKLRAYAKRQHHCFTAAQAVELGYADSVHLYHVKAGNWIRVYRGVYRLANEAETPATRCMAALLWSRDKSGVIQAALSAQTARELRDDTLAPADPIGLVVPKSFRRSVNPPDGLKITRATDEELRETSNIMGMPALPLPETPSKAESAKPETPPGFKDINDYYDWLDYHRVQQSSKR
ncbi:MAG: type IV toxin-antitoxin system AbiEi family antitoxin domain-containing protein [Lentisphaerae bacterium]|jgi:hypothetical protein|nr:type IV toxin-antitoxin system AbiEi family antitoxin domain-containing protein [Lentisphaerota bacterium]